MESIYDDHFFKKNDGDRELFREIEVDGTLLIIRSGIIDFKKRDILENTRLFSSDVDLIRAWKIQVEAWKSEGFLRSKKKESKNTLKSMPQNPGDTIAEIIAAIEARLTPFQRKTFASPPPMQILQQHFDSIGFQIPTFMKELYSWHGGCYEFLPEFDRDCEELREDYSGFSWLPIEEALAERMGFLEAWTNKSEPFVFEKSWLMIFGDDSNGFAVDLSSVLANPPLIAIDHEVGARQSRYSLCDALRKVYFAIENDAWKPGDGE